MLKALLSLCLALPLLSAAPPAQRKPRVKVTTSLGAFTLELEPEMAPKTVVNFMKYVRSGHYAGTTFHRVIPTFMIQGGGHLADLSEKPTKDQVENEADISLARGLKNARGTVAMARTSEPHSASAQFFVNTVDNEFLNHRGKDNRNWGYCAFGRVVAGMETVDKIKAVPTGRGSNGMTDVPLSPVTILSVKEEASASPAKIATTPAPKKTRK